jgi:hypothetical protein
MEQITHLNLFKFSTRYVSICIGLGLALLLIFYLFPTSANMFVGIFGAILLLFSASGTVFLLFLSIIYAIQRKIGLSLWLKTISVLLGAVVIGFIILETGIKLDR